MPLFPDTNALGALEWNPAELELKEKKREREKEKEKWKIILQTFLAMQLGGKLHQLLSRVPNKAEDRRAVNHSVQCHTG